MITSIRKAIFLSSIANFSKLFYVEDDSTTDVVTKIEFQWTNKNSNETYMQIMENEIFFDLLRYWVIQEWYKYE